MKFLEILSEAPIEDFSMVGDWNKSSSFRHEQDRKLLTNPKAQAKIIQKWINTPVPFNLTFVNFPGAGKFLEQGVVSHQWLQTNMPKVYPQLKLRDDAVNIIFTNNSGAERAPMTAWIIAHRFGHALQRFQKNYAFQEFFKHMQDQTHSIVNEIYGVKKPPRSYGYSSYNEPATKDFSSAVMAFLTAIGTFKSARDNNIRNENEWYLEVLAQYMLTGKVTFNPVPRYLPFGKMAWGRATNGRSMDPNIMDEVNEQLEQLASDATDYCEQIMHSAVGEIYVM